MLSALKPFLPVASLAFSAVVFGPLQVYFTNTPDFPFVAWEYVLWVAVPALLVTCVLGLAVTHLPEGWAERGQALLVALSLAAWVQSSFIFWRLGPLDGREIPWNEHPWQAMDALLWLTLLVLPQVVGRLRRLDVVYRLAGALLLLQLSASVFSYATVREFPELKAHAIDDSEQFAFSRKQNGLLIVLDEFQSNIFSEVLVREPALAAHFDGFTFFEDALAPAGYTFPSIPAMLTGQMYDNQIPAAQFLERTSSTSIFRFLIDNGFRVDLYPWTKDTLFLSPTIASNLKPVEGRLPEVARVIDVHLFKAAPFLLKRFVLNDGRWLLQQGLKRVPGGDVSRDPGSLPGFAAGLEHATAEATDRRFKYFHLMGMHVALSFNEELEYEQMDYSRENYLRQAIGVTRLMGELCATLRSLGIYDSSLIIIASDHGSGRSRDMWIDATNPAERLFNGDKARAAALLLVKPPGARGPLQFSAAPVSQLDVPATVADIFGLSGAVVVGQNVFRVVPGDRRERKYFSYRWARFNPLFLAPLREYIVTGPASRDQSWRNTGRVLEPARP